MALTPQQELFAQNVAAGKSQAEAYRTAYPRSAKWKSVHQTASRMMANANISARVDEIRAEIAEKGLWTREESVKTLKGVIANPDKAGDITAAVKELNAMHGFNEPIKHQVTGADGGPVQVAGITITIVDAKADEGVDAEY